MMGMICIGLVDQSFKSEINQMSKFDNLFLVFPKVMASEQCGKYN